MTKERFSFYTFVDHESQMVMTLNMWTDKSMTLNVDRIEETKKGVELKSQQIEIPAKPTMQDLEKKHFDYIRMPRL
jgi:hypothetical protein